MWFFTSPEIVFGEDALSYLDEIEGRRALIVTDQNMVRLGFVDRVVGHLKEAGIEAQVFAEVEPDPSLETARRGAQVALAYEPDWIVGLGGGSCLDAAKAVWVLYERPDMEPDAISPAETLGLRQKARLITIPTTSGTGAEATWAIVLTDTKARRKLGLGSRENVADIAVVDPAFVAQLPPQLTADTGMDALTHAVEGYTCTWHNDFSDGLCLKAIQLVFEYLPRAHERGDIEARERMHNAATIAGLGFGNALAALAHSLGHSLGAVFHVPHGRAVGLFLPYTIEFSVRGGGTRYAEIARFLGLPAESEEEGAASLVSAIRGLLERLGQPAAIKELGIPPDEFEAELPTLVENAENDSCTVTSPRVPTTEEFELLFRYAYEGKGVDF
ncbi:MAG TPA: iron-containing alcohol dehydrogenase [Anaerolineae bacterium]|nr:iron-containing alcohol dehydrogenase [Anaerolineae bacterium]